jgi:hypothetical protein
MSGFGWEAHASGCQRLKQSAVSSHAPRSSFRYSVSVISRHYLAWIPWAPKSASGLRHYGLPPYFPVSTISHALCGASDTSICVAVAWREPGGLYTQTLMLQGRPFESGSNLFCTDLTRHCAAWDRLLMVTGHFTRLDSSAPTTDAVLRYRPRFQQIRPDMVNSPMRARPSRWPAWPGQAIQDAPAASYTSLYVVSRGRFARLCVCVGNKGS